MSAFWEDLAFIFGDKYGLHILGSYAVTIAVIGVLLWAIVSANARARRELQRYDRERQE